MIDRQRKFIFIHLPKTGGSSLEVLLTGREAFGDHTQADNALSADPLFREFFPRGRHATLREYENYLATQGDSIVNYAVVSLIRDPFAMMRSLYKFRIKNFVNVKQRNTALRNLLHHLNTSHFNVFLGISLLAYIAQFLPLTYVKRRASYLGLFRHYFANRAGVRVRIFRLEDVGENLQPLLDALGVEQDIQLPRFNRSGGEQGAPNNGLWSRFVVHTIYARRIRTFYSDNAAAGKAAAVKQV